MVLRYAMVEMDRKIQEMERKQARAVPSRVIKAAGVTTNQWKAGS